MVSGPYLIEDAKGTYRKAIKIRFMDCVLDEEQRQVLGKKRIFTTTYARYVMEVHLGRMLRRDENIEHQDGDVLNDDISNLKIVDRTSAQKEWAKNLPDISPNRIKKLAREAAEAEAAKDSYPNYYHQSA